MLALDLPFNVLSNSKVSKPFKAFNLFSYLPVFNHPRDSLCCLSVKEICELYKHGCILSNWLSNIFYNNLEQIETLCNYFV